MKWFKIPKPINQQVGIHEVAINGKTYCLIHHNDSWFVTSNNCPHAGAKICKGWLENGEIVCPVHRHRFDLQTGRGAVGQGDYLHTYHVIEQGDDLLIRMPSSILEKVLNFFKKNNG